MPRPPRLCTTCGKVHALADRCAGQIAQDRARKARHDLHRPNAGERGYGALWRKARAEFLRLFPWCTCGAPATTVDHKVPHRGDQRLFWDRNNWQPLCAHCHNSRKQRLERTQVQS